MTMLLESFSSYERARGRFINLLEFRQSRMFFKVILVYLAESFWLRLITLIGGADLEVLVQHFPVRTVWFSHRKTYCTTADVTP